MLLDPNSSTKDLIQIFVARKTLVSIPIKIIKANDRNHFLSSKELVTLMTLVYLYDIRNLIYHHV